MRIHFSAEEPCALRLGGAMLGSVGEAEKFADVDREEITAEFLPDDGNKLPAVFRIGEKFFNAPPACAEVYRYDCGADIHVRFSPRPARLRVLAQQRFGGALMTVFSEAGAQLALDCAGKSELFDLPEADVYSLAEHKIGGETFYSVLCSRGAQNTLCLYNGQAREAFRDTVSDFSCGDNLRTVFRFGDIAGHTAIRTYRAEGDSLIPSSYSVHPREGFSPADLHEKLLPFAFFQEILAGGDPAPYLAPSLAEKKQLLREYLGEFCGVYLPKEIFYLTHGQQNAAGLVYRRAENSFEVRFFQASTAEGKIVNISPVE